MQEELKNLATTRPNTRPPQFGRTILARVASHDDPGSTLERFKIAWRVAAEWGRWCDDELGDWPSVTECVANLPAWLGTALQQEAGSEVENWLDDVHDRDWVLWSASLLDRVLKIDLNSESMPISTWTIEYVLSEAGANVLYRGDWLSEKEADQRSRIV